MPNPIESLSRAAAALRGDDALARAAADAAAPRRRLLAALRDAHAETTLRAAALRAAEAAAPGRAMLPRLREEAEEQLRRLEQVFADLGERPGVGRRAGATVASRPARPWQAGASLAALEGEECRGAAEARALRDLAHLAGQHLAARLLDLTAEERAASAREIGQPAGPLRLDA